MRFGLFFLAEYLSVFAISCLGTVLFLGGGTLLPFVSFPTNLLGDSVFSYVVVDAILLAVFLGKVLFFIFLMFWIRATLPRMRVDRLMNYSWKYLVPLAIVNVLIAGIWYEMVIRPGSLTLGHWLLGSLVTGILVVAAVAIIVTVNRRTSTRNLLGAAWPSVGRLRPGLGMRTLTR
jgi:NADH-quinone oxidoreductase subunit H